MTVEITVSVQKGAKENVVVALVEDAGIKQIALVKPNGSTKVNICKGVALTVEEYEPEIHDEDLGLVVEEGLKADAEEEEGQ